MGEAGREQLEAATGRALKFGEWVALVSICAADDSPARAHDAAMIALFKIAGLRRAEMVALNLADYDREHQTLTVRGKRNKTHVIPIEDAGALDALADWLYILSVKGIRQGMTGPLSTRVTKGGQIMTENEHKSVPSSKF
jgi:site-specific recombinase XerC